MAGSNNFLQWNPSKTNQENDSAYAADSLRSGGITTDAIFGSPVANKLFYQVTTFVAAFGAAFASKGYAMSDASLTALQAILVQILTNNDISQSLANPGYINFGPILGGFIIQWGQDNNGSNPMTVDFPLAFPNSCLAVVFASNNYGANATRNVAYLTAAPTTTEFTAQTDSSSISINWIAIGF